MAKKFLNLIFYELIQDNIAEVIIKYLFLS